jgi:phosphoribosylformimino-5-aminoimidazole carboxamide ribotide isomerase
MIITPAIDIIGGKCVRLVKGDYTNKKVYSENPLEMARMFESWGLKRLHLVDLDGAKEGKMVNRNVLEMIASQTNLAVDFGGGIRNESDIYTAIESGAKMVVIGSLAVREPELFLRWVQRFGNKRIILGADHRDEKIEIQGWLENSGLELFSFLDRNISGKIEKVICTDINRDGMLKGPSLELYKRILKAWPQLHLIASGGVSCIGDIEDLNEAGVPEVVVGKAIYEGRITQNEVTGFIIHNS